MKLRPSALLALALITVGASGFQQTKDGPSGQRIILPNDLKWVPDAPGFSHADLWGNPDGPGLYIFRSKSEDGTILPPHWHPKDENFTVISGTFLVGMGDKFDERALLEVPTGAHMLNPSEDASFLQEQRRNRN